MILYRLLFGNQARDINANDKLQKYVQGHGHIQRECYQPFFAASALVLYAKCQGAQVGD